MSPGSAGNAGASGPGTPSRLGQPLAPSVVISPSAPVSTNALALSLSRPLTHTCKYTYHSNILMCCRSTFLPLVPPRRCRAILRLPRLVRSRAYSTVFKRRPRTPSRAFERRNDSIHRASTSQISASVSWRSCPGFTKCPPTSARSSSCRRLTSATSSSISTMLAVT